MCYSGFQWRLLITPGGPKTGGQTETPGHEVPLFRQQEGPKRENQMAVTEKKWEEQSAEAAVEESWAGRTALTFRCDGNVQGRAEPF